MPWLPTSIRNIMTDLLAHQVQSSNVYTAVVPKLADAISRSGQHSILDLCAGGLSSIHVLQQLPNLLERKLKIRLTDKFPNRNRFDALASTSTSTLTFEDEPVDVLEVPAKMNGFRTIFSAFHHFEPKQCIRILQNAVQSKEPIGIFEFTERSPLFVLLGALVGFPVIMLSCLTLRPITFERLFWCFIVPVVPIMFYWDGFVSGMRSYRPDELQAFVDQADSTHAYSWDIGRIPSTEATGLHVTYLIGVPTNSAQCSDRQLS